MHQPMELAKPYVDLGIFTNQVELLDRFYQETAAVELEAVLTLPSFSLWGMEAKQHRYQLYGAVLKVNQCPDPLPEPMSGYRTLIIADAARKQVQAFRDPDGLEVQICPPGWKDVTTVGVECVVEDVAAQAEFLTAGLGARPAGDDRYRIGNTVFLIRQGEQPRAGDIRRRGLTYVTLQVHDVVAAHRHVVDLGFENGHQPIRIGNLAAISFVRDPAGNWLELSQRASLTGALPELGPALTISTTGG